MPAVAGNGFRREDRIDEESTASSDYSGFKGEGIQIPIGLRKRTGGNPRGMVLHSEQQNYRFWPPMLSYGLLSDRSALL